MLNSNTKEQQSWPKGFYFVIWKALKFHHVPASLSLKLKPLITAQILFGYEDV